MNQKSATPATLEEILHIVKDLQYFHPEGEEPAAIPLHYVPGKVPLVLIVGPNAGGKSFFRRIITAICKQETPRIECMALSMEFRTGGGYGPARAMVFGDESWEATGQISAHTVTTGIQTCRARETPHVIFWDEPDIGLSEGYARGAGQTIAKFASDLPKHTIAAFVVTHSKPLVREVVGLEPHYLHLGSETAPPTLQAWLDLVAAPLDLDSLRDASRQRFAKIQKILAARERRR